MIIIIKRCLSLVLNFMLYSFERVVRYCKSNVLNWTSPWLVLSHKHLRKSNISHIIYKKHTMHLKINQHCVHMHTSIVILFPLFTFVCFSSGMMTYTLTMQCHVRVWNKLNDLYSNELHRFIDLYIDSFILVLHFKRN